MKLIVSTSPNDHWVTQRIPANTRKTKAITTELPEILQDLRNRVSGKLKVIAFISAYELYQAGLLLISTKQSGELLWENIQTLLKSSEDAYVVFDDTVLDKRYGHHIELSCRFYSGTEHCVIRGISSSEKGVIKLRYRR